MPGTPTSVTVEQVEGNHFFGNGKVLVSFTAADGNATSFRATASTGQFADNAVSPILIDKLAGGVPVTVTVQARNNVTGNSASSAPSASITPATAPNAVTMGTATAGNTTASVTFTAPTDNGGSPITAIKAGTSHFPPGIIGSSLTSPITINGLTNGTPYRFLAWATNAIGDGTDSALSNQVTPATVPPDAPTIGVAVRGNTRATVAFTPAATGPPASSYTVTSSPGGVTETGEGSPITIDGLTNGVSYTFTVHASNGLGNSAESAASNAVTPEALTPITDAFEGGAGTLATTDTGQAWTALGSAVFSQDGSGSAHQTGGGAQSQVVVESSYSDCTVQVTMAVAGDAGPCFRVTDVDNGFVWNGSALFRKQGGSFTQLNIAVAPDANGDVIAAVLLGNSITIKRNGVTIIAVTDAFNAGATKHGLRCNGSSTPRFDDFSIA